MAKYRCAVCGYVYDEEKEGAPFSALQKCPMCMAGTEHFEKIDEEDAPAKTDSPAPEPSDLRYDPTTARSDKKNRYMDMIHQIAVTGATVDGAMATQIALPSWDEILFLGAQLSRRPLEVDDNVNAETVIGKHAKKPMVLQSPVYVSHMSFGALSKEAKVALSQGSALAHTAMCSGEGGILPEERAAAYRYIFEYVPNQYSVTEENLRGADAIEIKIGQGTKPGMGGHLPGAKVTPEIAKVREKPQGQDVQSPAKFKEIVTQDDLTALVTDLRTRSDGQPIGIKIAAGHIEEDLEMCVNAGADFITIDGRGGATGSSPAILRDASSVPTIYALIRARKYLDAVNAPQELVITGGLRVSADFAKALALGADAVAVATGALIAAGCQQYKICGSGNCPVGIATQDPALRKRFQGEAAAKRVANYLTVSTEEIKMFARITGKDDVHALSSDDLCTTSRAIAKAAGIARAEESVK